MIHMIEREIRGFCHNNFQNVAEVFSTNLNSDEEVGASFTVIQNSEILVDIHGGFKDKEETDPWNADTLVGVHSTGKGIVSMIIALLIDQNILSLDENVSTYWPEFKGDGKEEITVRTLLSHQAGMYAWREKVHEDDFLNWEYIVELLEKQCPFHKPHELICYHPKTIGFLVGELVRKVTKKSVGEFLKEKLSTPLNAHCFIGTPEIYHSNIATLISAPSLRKAFSDPKILTNILSFHSSILEIEPKQQIQKNIALLKYQLSIVIAIHDLLLKFMIIFSIVILLVKKHSIKLHQ